MAGLALAQTGQPVATGNWRHSGLLQGFVVVGQLQSIGAGMRLRQFAQHLHMPRVVSFHWGWRILVEIYNRDMYIYIYVYNRDKYIIYIYSVYLIGI